MDISEYFNTGRDVEVTVKYDHELRGYFIYHSTTNEFGLMMEHLGVGFSFDSAKKHLNSLLHIDEKTPKEESVEFMLEE